MRALKCDASKGELTLEDVDVPEVINRNDVIIKVGFAGLCGTDLHIMQVYTEEGGTTSNEQNTCYVMKCRQHSVKN